MLGQSVPSYPLNTADSPNSTAKKTIMNITTKTFITRLWIALVLAGLGIVTLSALSSAATIAIGDNYGGGKVIYILQPGDNGYEVKVQHGLIADQSDISGLFDWPDALAICDKMKKNGYRDWYLPNKDELNKVYIKKAVIGGFVKNSARQSFYWSSSEKDADYSWSQNFKVGTRFPADKMKKGHVRAVRTF